MLLPLLFLFAVPGLTDASFSFQIDNNTQVNTSDCPITYYGQEYTTVYTNFTGEHLFVCFNGYYTPEGNKDCIRVPNTDNKANFVLNNDDVPFYWRYATDMIQARVSTVTNNVTCYLHFYYTSDMILWGMGSQSVVYWHRAPQKFVSVLVNGDVVENVFGVQNNYSISDTSGCRILGLGVKPGTTRQIPDTCTFLTCSSTRIPSTKTCGPPGQCNGNGTFSNSSLDPSTLECVDVSDGQTPPPANTTVTPTQNVIVTKQTTPEPSTQSPTDESTVSTQLIPAGKNFVVALSIEISTILSLEDIKDEFLSQLKAEFVRRGLPPDLGLRILKSQRV
ncbi:hypothetical protein OJAV_G00183950 [Oryzias javanicus]|uniref:Sushi domain-containing protein n=1 Tax=Oryzias javanicus TaxID=123683 RepID=A0A3S2PTS0_ORYJA|nr:hypothetical protein OJAV_G00183950 [Oryzias javanicus]